MRNEISAFRKKARKRLKKMLLSWLLNKTEGNIMENMDYTQLKELAHDRSNWCQ